MGMSRVEVAVLLVTSVAQATTRQSIRFRTHGSRDERPVSWSPSQSERPETCASGQRVVSSVQDSIPMCSEEHLPSLGVLIRIQIQENFIIHKKCIK